MQIVHKDLRRGELKIRITSPEDVWVLAHILKPGDVVAGRTLRKVKRSEEAEGVRKPMFLKIALVKVSAEGGKLRMLGRILEEKENVPKGAYHSIDADVGDVLDVFRESWGRADLKRISDATKIKEGNVLICIVDRESSCFALLRNYGYEVISEEKWGVCKKFKGVKGESIFPNVAKRIFELAEHVNPVCIIVASPSFWKEEVIKILKEKKIGIRIVEASCNYVGKEGIEELLKREEVKTAMQGARIYEETKLVEQLLKEVAVNGRCAYGLREAEEMAEAGNVEKLLVTDSFAKEKYNETEKIIRAVEEKHGEVFIISGKYESGKKLDGLGGIAVILRYKANY
ncbi:mRNA surveillance protein pelota [archaeon]|nr:mRNA surveillance protein pelota [archaeon]